MLNSTSTEMFLWGLSPVDQRPLISLRVKVQECVCNPSLMGSHLLTLENGET